MASWSRVTHLLLTPDFIDGGLSPPPVGPVDDVIVHQAGGVDHLGDHGDGALPWQQIAAEVKGHGKKSTPLSQPC